MVQESIKTTLTSGASSIIYLQDIQYPATVGVIPSVTAGVTASIEYSISPKVDIETTTAKWADWNIGDTTAAAIDSLQSPITALRLSSSGTAGSSEFLISTIRLP